MTINLFEGSRRIALLVASIATFGTLVALITSDPYVSMGYSIARPGGSFVRNSDSCPSDAGRHYFSTKTKSGKTVRIDLCLLTMTFGEKNQSLIPYKVDEKGMIWGAASYNSEVSEYERQLERQFVLSEADSGFAEKEIARRYWESFREGLVYLAIGLVIFWGLIWAIGWIMRGFLGIPRNMDKRPEQAQQGAQANGPASGGTSA